MNLGSKDKGQGAGDVSKKGGAKSDANAVLAGSGDPTK